MAESARFSRGQFWLGLGVATLAAWFLVSVVALAPDWSPEAWGLAAGFGLPIAILVAGLVSPFLASSLAVGRTGALYAARFGAIVGGILGAVVGFFAYAAVPIQQAVLAPAFPLGGACIGCVAALAGRLVMGRPKAAT